jgi:hypothetical protein
MNEKVNLPAVHEQAWTNFHPLVPKFVRIFSALARVFNELVGNVSRAILVAVKAGLFV